MVLSLINLFYHGIIGQHLVQPRIGKSQLYAAASLEESDHINRLLLSPLSFIYTISLDGILVHYFFYVFSPGMNGDMLPTLTEDESLIILFQLNENTLQITLYSTTDFKIIGIIYNETYSSRDLQYIAAQVC